MGDINNLSLEDLIRFAEGGELPAGQVDTKAAAQALAPAPDDINALTPEALLALATGPAASPAAPMPAEKPAAKEEPSGEATEEELLAMLSNTVSEDEISGVSNIDYDLAKTIDKMKLRQLANRIDQAAPPKLFPKRRDEIYYFLASMTGQSPKIRIDDAEKKCKYIGESLESLKSYMLTDVGMSVDEQDTLIAIFKEFSSSTVKEADTRQRVFQQFRGGWQSTMKAMTRDIQSLQKQSLEPKKPVWVLIRFYENLIRAYGLCRASEELSQYAEELGVTMSREDKRQIVNAFEDVMDVAPHYGLRSLSYTDRKSAYAELERLDLAGVLKKLNQRVGRKG